MGTFSVAVIKHYYPGNIEKEESIMVGNREASNRDRKLKDLQPKAGRSVVDGGGEGTASGGNLKISKPTSCDTLPVTHFRQQGSTF